MNGTSPVPHQPQVRAGAYLADSSQPIPLLGVRATAEISGASSRVVLRQLFRNAEPKPVEAVYVFPLPEGAAVCGLAIETGGRRIAGKVLPREEAFDAYDDAMLAGHGAVLLDQERPNVFTASVGNLLPGQELAVELTWVEELAWEGRALRFLLPTTVSPRYVPAEDAAGVSPTPGERVTPPVALRVPYGFTFEASVSSPGGLASVESPTHPLRVELDGDRARVSLSSEVAAMDRDVVVLIEPKRAREPRATLERQPDGSLVAAVSWVPALGEGRREPREVVFLVDRSGSMAGSSIEQVRAALDLCLRSLAEGDSFDIVSFGSGWESLFGACRPYTQEALAEAAAAVEAMDGDLGGTEILPALEAVLERKAGKGATRTVVLLTDGEVSNDDAVIALAGAHAGRCRIFTFGIGHGASEHLVRALARVTDGAAEFIVPGERIAPKVMRQFARIGAPAVRDLAVEWAGATPAWQAPSGIAAAFDGEPLRVWANFAKGAPSAATLRGTVGGEPASWVVPIDARAAEGTLLGTLAARAAIRDVEEGGSALDRRGGSRQRGRAATRVREQIVRLATAYSLASRETSFVAVEEREGAEAAEAPELRRIPVALTHGWGGVQIREARMMALPDMSVCALMAPVPAAPAGRRSRRRAAPPIASMVCCEDALQPYSDANMGPPSPDDLGDGPPYAFSRTLGTSRQLPHLTIARLQRADGSWALDAAFAEAVGVGLEALEALAAELGPGETPRAVAATAVAIRVLRERFLEFEDEWRLLADKAGQWLERTAGAASPAIDLEELERKAAPLLSRPTP